MEVVWGRALTYRMGFVFEDLRVYQRAERNLEVAYEVAAALPDTERFNLAEQLRRAALSVALNIAESTERTGPRDAVRFVRIALGSVVEVIACLRIANRPHAISRELSQGAIADYELLYRQLHAYRRSLQRPGQ